MVQSVEGSAESPERRVVERHRTAIGRAGLSRPVRRAVEDGLIGLDTIVFDYGCGRGDDVRALAAAGVACAGWDPVHRPDTPRVASDVVNLGYVVNVIEDPAERATALRSAWALTAKALVVAARLTSGVSPGAKVPFVDGVLTSRNTFQKYFDQQELRAWVDDTLDVASVPAAPGILYVFRDDAERSAFLAGRQRQRVVVPTARRLDAHYEEHRDALGPLAAFVADRGRLPDPDELPNFDEVRARLGSIRRAFDLVRRATGPEQWDRIRESRARDLLVYIALGKFTRRPPFASLPPSLQRDIRAFFSTYTAACARADEVLFSAGDAKAVDEACRASGVGKLTPSALYVHESALGSLAPLLRIYEGCARVLVGVVESANIVKLHRDEPRISYLSYPGFDRTAHPGLEFSLAVNLRTFRESVRTYGGENAPVLHRKELFVGPDYPLRAKFARLTAQEEKASLLDESLAIGRRAAWDDRLRRSGYRVVGHRLLRISSE